MAQRPSQIWPTMASAAGSGGSIAAALPAAYHNCESIARKKQRVVNNPAHSVTRFLEAELSLKVLEQMLRHLWFAGARRPATQLHLQVAMGRQITVADRMDLHLFWDPSGKLFLKPVPNFLLDREFLQNHLECPDGCACEDPLPATCKAGLRSVAFGFLYTYACLVSSETDFFVASEARLLPRREDGSSVTWADWKEWVGEFLDQRKNFKVHPRFQRAELRLSRVNTIHRFTRFPPFVPYLRGRNNYSSLFRDNFAWMAATTVFIALVLAAMQVGLATDRLKNDAAFQEASYSFTIFAIVGPVSAFGLLILVALLHLAQDLPSIFTDMRTQTQAPPTGAMA